jgi:hypothetical protein
MLGLFKELFLTNRLVGLLNLSQTKELVKPGKIESVNSVQLITKFKLYYKPNHLKLGGEKKYK